MLEWDGVSDLSEAPETLDGWWALHSLGQFDWTAWKDASAKERSEAISEAASFFAQAQEVEAEDRGSTGFYWILGHKGDLLQIHLRPSMGELAALERAFDRTALARYLKKSYSYLSVVEMSTYGSKDGKAPEGDPLENPYLKKRLQPHLPRTEAVCFYPMDKKRGETENWYALPMQERRELMASHGLIGRTYAGRVSQMITGSVGLDDWEWGVTLFADDPLQFKKLIYEMRFDEVSSRYAVFGPFYVGLRQESADLATTLEV